MISDLNLSFAQYKANLALLLRTAKLLQEGRQLWLATGTERINDRISETGAELDQLIESEDWQALTALPSRTTWRLLQRQMSDLQAITEAAIGNQTAFFDGYQQAMASWQQESALALSQTASAMPIHAMWKSLLQNVGVLDTGANGT
ncbi:phasin family protein [Cupriavidus basilensis]